MPSSTSDWEDRVDRLWASFDDVEPADFRTAMDALAAELPPGEPVGLFERAGAFDATDRPEAAIPLYWEALTRGLDPHRHRQALIQLASSLRNLGHTDEALHLLNGERARASDELDDEVAAFLALCLADHGAEREALSLALTTLAPHLKQYRRSVTQYAEALRDQASS